MTDGVARSAPRVGPQHNRAKSALRGACSVGGRSILHGAKSARAARHGFRTQCLRPVEDRAPDLSRCWCGRAPADGVGRSASPVGLQHNHSKSAMRATRRAYSVGGRPILYGAKSARAALHGTQTQRPRPFEARAVHLSWRGAVEPRPTALGGAPPALGHNTTTPSPHRAARTLCARSASTLRDKKRAGRAPRGSNAMTTVA